MVLAVIPKQLEELVFGPRENSRGSKIANGLVLRQYKPVCDL